MSKERSTGCERLMTLHHVEAFGLIDRDGRTDDRCRCGSLRSTCSSAVGTCVSVEALYYCSDAIAESRTDRQAETLGSDWLMS